MPSLSQKAYEALSRSAAAPDDITRKPRPDGPMIWAIVQDESDLKAAIYLHDRVAQTRADVHVLIASGAELVDLVPRGYLWEALPADTGAYARGAIAHWRPSICVWFGGNLMPLLVAQMRASGAAMLLLDAKMELIDTKGWGWVPKLARDTFASFEMITTAEAECHKALAKLLPPQTSLQKRPALQVATPPPPAPPRVLEDVASMMAGRPAWCAYRVQEGEISDVLAAHRTSIRLSHRLLLVMVCASFPIAMTARTRLARDGWRCAFWDDGDEIDESTQIVLVEDTDERGLWLRMAPVTFMGSSIEAGHGGSDPYEAAALGTAIIYGPNVGKHLDSYSRLASVGAARIVSDADGLSRALAHLLAVDSAATMVQAAWEIVSTGAEETDRIADTLLDILDTRDGAR